MTDTPLENRFDVTIIGAGVAGISSGYFLARAGLKVALIDKLPPMSFTSAQSGENYRNWWPHPVMTEFTNHSIDLLEELSRQTDNCMLMTRRGYLLASRNNDSDVVIDQLYAGYGLTAADQIRLYDKGDSSGYVPAHSADWENALNGVDVVQNKDLIRQHYPHLDTEVSRLIHIRRAGEISFHPLAQFMLSYIRKHGGRLLQGSVQQIEKEGNGGFIISYNQGQQREIYSQKIVNAAGPFAKEIAQLLGVDLPIKNILQQKIAFEDNHGAIPRNIPFSVDLDDCTLHWDEEDRELLQSDPDCRWLTEPIMGGIHCRPDGGEAGRWVKLGWAFNGDVTQPKWDPDMNPLFPDLVLRGASRLNPALKHYLGRLPRNCIHYGGYYSMTDENWPIIGPIGIENAYIVGALSGFGTMAACGSGDLITKWIMGDTLPDYAEQLSLRRYADTGLMETLRSLSTGAL